MIKNLIIAVLVVAILGETTLLVQKIQDQNQNLAGTAINVPQFTVASSTVYTLTTASQQLLATSSRRVAASLQTHNCTLGSYVFLRAENGAAAVANTGMLIISSSTDFGTFPEAKPVPTGGVAGITNSGTCLVLVTEWRTTN